MMPNNFGGQQNFSVPPPSFGGNQQFKSDNQGNQGNWQPPSGGGEFLFFNQGDIHFVQGKLLVDIVFKGDIIMCIEY